jgi:hypothetical protein
MLDLPQPVVCFSSPLGSRRISGACSWHRSEHYSGEAIALLASGGQTARHHGQHLDGYAWALHPKQDHKLYVVDHSIQPGAALLIGPAHVARSRLVSFWAAAARRISAARC